MYSFRRSKAIIAQAIRIIYLSSPTMQKVWLELHNMCTSDLHCKIITIEEEVFISPLHTLTTIVKLPFLIENEWNRCRFEEH